MRLSCTRPSMAGGYIHFRSKLAYGGIEQLRCTVEPTKARIGFGGDIFKAEPSSPKKEPDRFVIVAMIDTLY